MTIASPRTWRGISWRRRRFLIGLYPRQLPVNRDRSIDIGCRVTICEGAGSLAGPVDEIDTEDARRQTLNEHHRLQRPRFEQGEKKSADGRDILGGDDRSRSEEHTSELQSRFGISYAVFCLK